MLSGMAVLQSPQMMSRLSFLKLHPNAVSACDQSHPGSPPLTFKRTFCILCKIILCINKVEGRTWLSLPSFFGTFVVMCNLHRLLCTHSRLQIRLRAVMSISLRVLPRSNHYNMQECATRVEVQDYKPWLHTYVTTKRQPVINIHDRLAVCTRVFVQLT